jgi:hypothetical protein
MTGVYVQKKEHKPELALTKILAELLMLNLK